MEELTDYITDHISPEPPHLQKLYRDTHLHHLYPRMCSGHLQGRILKMLTSMINPTYVLELGTYTGYSALCMAEGMADDGELHTIELDDELEDELRQRFETAPNGNKITLHIGDAEQIIPTIDRQWDMVFIDANKRRYPQYFDLLLPRVKPGGYILADNTLWDGKVAQTPPPTDAQSQGIMQFNDIVARNPRIETVILPLRDGLTLMRKRP